MLCGCGLLLVYFIRLNSARQVVTDQGVVVRDMTSLEAGVFADEASRPLRLSYIENLEGYRKLNLIRWDADGKGVEATVGRVVTKALSAAPAASWEAIGGRNAERLTELVQRTLSRAAGTRLADYRPVNERGQLQLPLWLREQGVGGTDGDHGEVAQRVFRDRFALSAQPDSADRIVAVAGGEEGWRVGVRVKLSGLSEGELQDVLMAVLSSDDARRFRGHATQPAEVFHVRAGPPEDRPVAAVTWAVWSSRMQAATGIRCGSRCCGPAGTAIGGWAVCTGRCQCVRFRGPRWFTEVWHWEMVVFGSCDDLENWGVI